MVNHTLSAAPLLAPAACRVCFEFALIGMHMTMSVQAWCVTLTSGCVCVSICMYTYVYIYTHIQINTHTHAVEIRNAKWFEFHRFIVIQVLFCRKKTWPLAKIHWLLVTEHGHYGSVWFSWKETWLRKHVFLLFDGHFTVSPFFPHQNRIWTSHHCSFANWIWYFQLMHHSYLCVY